MLKTLCVCKKLYDGIVFKKLEFKEKYTKLNEAVTGFEQNESGDNLLHEENDKK